MKNINDLVGEEKTVAAGIHQKIRTIATEFGEKYVESEDSKKYGSFTYQFRNLQFRYYWWYDVGEPPTFGVDVEENGICIYNSGSTHIFQHLPGDWEKDVNELYKKASLIKKLREGNYPTECSQGN